MGKQPWQNRAVFLVTWSDLEALGGGRGGGRHLPPEEALQEGTPVRSTVEEGEPGEALNVELLQDQRDTKETALGGPYHSVCWPLSQSLVALNTALGGPNCSG